MQGKPFVLFCAGEDSGDVLGETLVRSAVDNGMNILGVGGPRMQRTGLILVGDYETLPVSGFGDVLPHIFRLKKIFSQLESRLKSDDCVALVCIDYPGFNMKLCRKAMALKKPVLYVAPPQVWAWKKHRARRLKGAKLAVLFDFERRIYESLGLNAELLEHPFPRTTGTRAIHPQTQATSPNQDIILLPGSRKSQAIRNLPFFMAVASQVHATNPEKNFVLAASRNSLKAQFERALVGSLAGTPNAGDIPAWLRIEVAPQGAKERADFYARHAAALCMPGSATLELALSGVPLVVADVLDPLTYFIGKHFVKTDYFALPNILLRRGAVPEFFFTRRSACKKSSVTAVAEALGKCNAETSRGIADDLDKTFVDAKNPESLMLEFLGEFVKRDAH